ncbi:hypothetical protein B1J94_06895 [Leptospira kirschneri serovar Grippotyphosa]|nr:hypothetical protein B1J94_06895 [Leptospira kirschneri serovar Grippotyphosa]
MKNSIIAITHNYIIKYLIFCVESVFCNKINDTQFYRDHYYSLGRMNRILGLDCFKNLNILILL